MTDLHILIMVDFMRLIKIDHDLIRKKECVDWFKLSDIITLYHNLNENISKNVKR